MNLVIVESPSKTKTIKQYLGNDYIVLASKGHIRDIKNTGVENLGLDFKNNYKPIYEVIENQDKTIDSLNDALKKCDKVYLATDPDREGEAISWHLNEVLDLNNKDVKRIEFNEITESAILNAIKNPREIDNNLFESQETRKIMDRLIGYKLSSILKTQFNNKYASAGRVQSVCLKMINEREEEIQKFIKEKYFHIEAEFNDFKAKLVDKNNNYQVLSLKSKEEADNILNQLDKQYEVFDIIEKKRYEKPFPPFTTSTLIQAALNKYSMPSKKTMTIAQMLYEGIDVNGKHIAFITYMRTDSTRISDEFQKKLYSHNLNKFGKDYIAPIRSKSVEGAQDAHEAIRPVSLSNTPESVEQYLTPDQFKIYSLIYNQAVEANLKDSELLTSDVILRNGDYYFKTTFEKVLFDGFKINRNEKKDEKVFNYKVKDTLLQKKVKIEEKETEGPSRFTEASLIKEMELSGIGRPSTYASTIETLKSKNYVTVSKKSFVPTKEGVLTYKFLKEYFEDIINVSYTKEMEEDLDKIAEGTNKEIDVVPLFYDKLDKTIKEKSNTFKPIFTGEACPKCGSPMVYRSNKNGIFEACSNYPTCKYIKKEEPKPVLEIECPECHSGHLIERKNFKGKPFYGCSNFPTCKFTISSLKGIKKK